MILETIVRLKHEAMAVGRRPTVVRMHPVLAESIARDYGLEVRPGVNYVVGLRIEERPDLSPEDISVDEEP